MVVEEDAKILGRLTAGENVRISRGAILYGPISLGDGAYVGPYAILGHPDRRELARLTSKEVSDASLYRDDARESFVGSEAIIRGGTILYSNVRLGERVAVGHHSLIREKVTIGDGSMVGTNVVIDGSCVIGRNVSIQTGVYISTYSTIKDDVFLGPNCVLLNDRYLARKKMKLLGPTIERGASVGGNATILDSVKIGEGAAVGAGAVVLEDVEPGVIVVGVPARPLKRVPEDWRIT